MVGVQKRSWKSDGSEPAVSTNSKAESASKSGFLNARATTSKTFWSGSLAAMARNTSSDHWSSFARMSSNAV